MLLEPETEGRYRLDGGAGSARFDCAAQKVELELGAERLQGQRIALREQPFAFTSHGDLLRGKIVGPATGEPAIYVVLVHGSERDSASFGNVWQYMLAAHGYGAVVYDKRGTGLSEGGYTQDFHLLSDDAVAAAAALRRDLPGSYQVGFWAPARAAGWRRSPPPRRRPIS